MISIAMKFPRSVGHVGHERNLTRALDGRLQRALMLRAHARDPPRLDLAALRDERRQQLHVLVVHVVDLLDAELADAPAAEESAAPAPLLVLVPVGRSAASAIHLAHRSPPPRMP